MTRHDSPERDELARVARLLLREWERVEEKPVSVSHIANFVDMARAVIADRQRAVRVADPEMPWGPPPTGEAAHYQDDGPTVPTVVQRRWPTADVDGVRLLVTPLDERGLHTGRVRYHIACLTCEAERGLMSALVHPATTGPRSRVVDHIRLHKETKR